MTSTLRAITAMELVSPVLVPFSRVSQKEGRHVIDTVMYVPFMELALAKVFCPRLSDQIKARNLGADFRFRL
jgi:hypothetical protein